MEYIDYFHKLKISKVRIIYSFILRTRETKILSLCTITSATMIPVEEFIKTSAELVLRTVHFSTLLLCLLNSPTLYAGNF